MGVDPQTIRDSMAAVAAATKAGEDAAAARAAAEKALELAQSQDARIAELSDRVTDTEVLAEASLPEPATEVLDRPADPTDPPPDDAPADQPPGDPAASPVADTKRGLLW